MSTSFSSGMSDPEFTKHLEAKICRKYGRKVVATQFCWTPDNPVKRRDELPSFLWNARDGFTEERLLPSNFFETGLSMKSLTFWQSEGKELWLHSDNQPTIESILKLDGLHLLPEDDDESEDANDVSADDDDGSEDEDEIASSTIQQPERWSLLNPRPNTTRPPPRDGSKILTVSLIACKLQAKQSLFDPCRIVACEQTFSMEDVKYDKSKTYRQHIPKRILKMFDCVTGQLLYPDDELGEIRAEDDFKAGSIGWFQTPDGTFSWPSRYTTRIIQLSTRAAWRDKELKYKANMPFSIRLHPSITKHRSEIRRLTRPSNGDVVATLWRWTSSLPKEVETLPEDLPALFQKAVDCFTQKPFFSDNPEDSEDLSEIYYWETKYGKVWRHNNEEEPSIEELDALESNSRESISTKERTTKSIWRNSKPPSETGIITGHEHRQRPISRDSRILYEQKYWPVKSDELDITKTCYENLPTSLLELKNFRTNKPLFSADVKGEERLKTLFEQGQVTWHQTPGGMFSWRVKQRNPTELELIIMCDIESEAIKNKAGMKE